jgi:hypothetical protein
MKAMKPIAKIVCGCAMLVWVHGATAGDITIRESGGSIILESTRGQAVPASAPQAVTAPVSSRVTVQPYTDTVDRARIEKRLEDRGTRTKKRVLEAEKDAAERAARSQR